MRATVSSKGQVVLSASVVLRPLSEPRAYKKARHPKSGLPVMLALKPPKRKVTAAETRLNAQEHVARQADSLQ